VSPSGQLRWLRSMLLSGIAYLVVGILTAAIAGAAASNKGRVAWRLAAWVISAAVFAANIWYEDVRMRSSHVRTALHVSLAVGLGAFGLAIAASVHGRNAPAQQHFPALAFVVWPIMTALPAFVAALACVAVLARIRSHTYMKL
jgi:hypothetical protein